MLESNYLQDNIQNIQKLMNIPALRKYESEKLSQLLRLSKIRQYEDAECIIAEGERDAWLYFLLSGAVRVEKQGITIAEIRDIGQVFGELRIVDSLNRSASVFAQGKTTCLAVDTSATDRLGPREKPAQFLLMLYRICMEFISMRFRLISDELVKCRRELESRSETQ